MKASEYKIPIVPTKNFWHPAGPNVEIGDMFIYNGNDCLDYVGKACREKSLKRKKSFYDKFMEFVKKRWKR